MPHDAAHLVAILGRPLVFALEARRGAAFVDGLVAGRHPRRQVHLEALNEILPRQFVVRGRGQDGVLTLGFHDGLLAAPELARA